jgi:hypothetical protein
VAMFRRVIPRKEGSLRTRVARRNASSASTGMEFCRAQQVMNLGAIMI